jgi:cytidylate kinase
MLNKQSRHVITVDGLAGSGKTALSRALAERIGYLHLSTGMIYRAVALLALNECIALDDSKAIIRLLDTHKVDVREADKWSSSVSIDSALVGEEIYQPRVSEATSLISRHAGVRAVLLEMQRRAFAGRDLVAEGRDMGTIVFVDADLKFFIEASPAVRAARRLAQLSGGGKLTVEELNRLKSELQIEIQERDRRDTERSVSPTRPADDAIIVDNSSQTLTEVVDAMYDLAARRGLVHL